MNISDIQDELLRSEYPYLLPDHDPDIERYYFLRGSGQSGDALNIFQSRLKPRYPDDEFRTALLRSYRSHDPAFRRLMGMAYRSLGERSLEQVKRSVGYIAGKAELYNRKDVYSTIRTAEDIMRLLPRDRFEAVAGIERLLRYAQVMNFQVKSMLRAVELIRAYLNQSLTVVEDERKRQKQKRQKEEDRERRMRFQNGGLLIDFSSVVFSPADLSRIEIPKTFTRIEDQILAFCVKYWNLTSDPAFEQILFLYSRKFGTKHYDVYMAIRRSKIAKRRDDEILSAVMSALVSGYYYSIRGDRYLQLRWNSIKPQLALPEVQAEFQPRSEPEKTVVVRRKKKSAVKKKRRLKTTDKKAKKNGKKQKPAIPGKRRRRAKVFPVPVSGSVSDRLQELSGRSYDLYRDRFFTHVRPVIRKQLGAGRRIFFTPPEEAENTIFYFLESYYDDPYMNWAESEDRKSLAELGFDLESLYPIIDECFGKL
jgi:hypothetical protein